MEPVDTQGQSVFIKNVKVVEYLNINMTKPNDVSKWPHLRGIPSQEVDIPEVMLLIGTNVSEVQVHLEFRSGGSGALYGLRTIFGWSVIGTLRTLSEVSYAKASDIALINVLQYGDVGFADERVSRY